MFERRLKLLLIILAIPSLLIVARLVQLQVVGAAVYQQKADSMLDRPPRYFPFLRGQIRDRNGHVLGRNSPTWDIAAHYGAFADIDEEWARYGRGLRRGSSRFKGRTDASLAQEIQDSWTLISELSGEPPERLRSRLADLNRQVRLIKAQVAKGLGVADIRITEQDAFHPIVKSLGRQEQIIARLQLADYPWFEVLANHRRRYEGGPAMGPILGQLSEVDRKTLQSDPHRRDELARYVAGDVHGVSGVEALAEPWLRGRRGKEHLNLAGLLVVESVAPEDGRALDLSIDLPLQQRLYDRLASTVAAYPYSTGGCAVVLDIPTRRVLAMVGYPSFDPNASWSERLELAKDRLRQPHVFRAMGKYYPPGSIIKPMMLAGGLASGKIKPETTFPCHGHLYPGLPDRWRCAGSAHFDVDPATSVQKSCNIFYYLLGERMGVPDIARWMSRFGFGQPACTGLLEEKAGRLPVTGWAGDAMNMAIGQGKLDVTPLQAANMIATIASGAYQQVTLLMDEPSERPVQRIPVSGEHWRIVREGLYRVVNVPGGTAHSALGRQRATLTDLGDLVLLGKTGSAEVMGQPVEWLFACRFPDGHEERIVARSRKELLERYAVGEKPEIFGYKTSRRFPPEGETPTHAWFVGYLASQDRYREPVMGGRYPIAIALVIEYAGHGGEVAGPVVRDMMHDILESQREWHSTSGRTEKW